MKRISEKMVGCKRVQEIIKKAVESGDPEMVVVIG